MPTLRRQLCVVRCSLQFSLCYFLVQIPFVHCDYHMCTNEYCEYVATPPCLFDVGRGVFSTTVGEREGVFKTFCPGGQPYKTAWVIEDTATYLDCSAIPSVIDLADGEQSYRLCVFHRKLKSEWISQLGHMDAIFFRSAKCSIEPPFYPIIHGVLRIVDVSSFVIGAAQIACGDYSKRIYIISEFFLSLLQYHLFRIVVAVECMQTMDMFSTLGGHADWL